jgi:chromatin structure-remodeling complex protein RSC7
VVDDYYEDKVLAEITARGLKPGDPVGELPDPQLYSNENASLKEAVSSSSSAFATVSGYGTGIYRAGGPTTIFGGSGWGPYSDGPLNPVRKGFLNREGVNEENWMYQAARRTREADDEWKKIRGENLRSLGKDIMQDVGITTGGKMIARAKNGLAITNKSHEEEEEDSDEEMEKAGKKTRVGDDPSSEPLGAYEPHNGTILCT